MEAQHQNMAQPAAKAEKKHVKPEGQQTKTMRHPDVRTAEKNMTAKTKTEAKPEGI